MNIESDKEKTIFRHEANGKPLYNIGLKHKKQDGSWENGYMSCRFPKEADIKDKSKIKIVSAWLDFYVKGKITHPYIFINKYELIEEIQQEVPQNIKTDYDNSQSDIQLNDDDLPF